jgi:hypothetical protein
MHCQLGGLNNRGMRCRVQQGVYFLRQRMAQRFAPPTVVAGLSRALFPLRVGSGLL